MGVCRFVESSYCNVGFPGGAVVKNPPASAGDRFDPYAWKIPWRREWQLASVFLPGKFHGQESLAGYSPWGLKEVDTTKELSTHAHIMKLGER